MDMEYNGMTVNERLYVSGLMEAFDIAVMEKDEIKVISILKKVDLNIDSIIPILKDLNLSIDSLPETGDEES